MDHEWILYLASFASAFGISLLVTPFAKTLSLKLGAIDYPRERGMHNAPIPRMGGVAIVLGFLLTTGIMAVFVPEFRTGEFIGFVVGAVMIAAAGMLDDIFTLRPRYKLLIQIISALVVVYSGTRIELVVWPVLTHFQSLAVPITMLWIIGMTNAINLIDGLDGLAAGVSAIGALCLMALCVLSGSVLAVVLAATLAGSCMGFLPRNFNPAEVIMGDTGALFLGYVLAVSSIMGVFKGYTVLSILIVFLAMSLPIFDTLFAMARRVIKRRPIMEADRGHLHHRLIDAGYSHKHAVMLLYGLSLVSAVMAVVIAVRDYRAILVMLVFLLVTVLVMYVYRKRTR